MRVLSNEVVFHDGNHNMAPRFLLWHDEYWMVFRSGRGHRSDDGKVVRARSKDLEHWTDPKTVINTRFDDRDPSLFVCGDKLFATSLSVDREWSDEHAGPFGVLKAQRECRCFVSHSEDGERWSEPRQVLPDNYVVWWPLELDGGVVASVQRRVPDSSRADFLEQMHGAGLQGCTRPLEFVRGVDRQSEIWRSEDGIAWSQVAVILDEDQASETALASVRGQIVALVRHDDHYHPETIRWRPDVLASSSPYSRWRHITRLDFPTNGPCVASVGGRLITCSRAFLDDARTPLNTRTVSKRMRGLILGELDVAQKDWSPLLMIPHRTGPIRASGSAGMPDISYAWIMDLGGAEFAMAYYEGYKGGPSDIRLARLAL